MDPLYLQDPIKPAATPQAAKGLRDAINNDSPMMSGFVSGTYGYGGSSLLGLANLAEVAGAESVRRGLRKKATALFDTAQKFTPSAMSLDSVKDFGSGVDYVRANAGQGLGSMLPVIAGGALGLAPGLAAATAPMYGENIGRLEQDPTLSGMSAGQKALHAAPTAAVQGALNYVVPGGFAAAAGRQIAAKTGTGALGKAGVTLGTVMGVEGATEGAESLARQGMHSLANQERDTSGDTKELIESTVSGAVGGSPIGAVQAGAGYVQDRMAERQQDTRTLSQKAGDAIADVGGVLGRRQGERDAAAANAALDAIQREAQERGVPPRDIINERIQRLNTPVDLSDAFTEAEATQRVMQDEESKRATADELVQSILNDPDAAPEMRRVAEEHVAAVQAGASNKYEETGLKLSEAERKRAGVMGLVDTIAKAIEPVAGKPAPAKRGSAMTPNAPRYSDEELYRHAKLYETVPDLRTLSINELSQLDRTIDRFAKGEFGPEVRRTLDTLFGSPEATETVLDFYKPGASTVNTQQYDPDGGRTGADRTVTQEDESFSEATERDEENPLPTETKVEWGTGSFKLGDNSYFDTKDAAQKERLAKTQSVLGRDKPGASPKTAAIGMVDAEIERRGVEDAEAQRAVKLEITNQFFPQMNFMPERPANYDKMDRLARTDYDRRFQAFEKELNKRVRATNLRFQTVKATSEASKGGGLDYNDEDIKSLSLNMGKTGLNNPKTAHTRGVLIFERSDAQTPMITSAPMLLRRAFQIGADREQTGDEVGKMQNLSDLLDMSIASVLDYSARKTAAQQDYAERGIRGEVAVDEMMPEAPKMQFTGRIGYVKYGKPVYVDKLRDLPDDFRLMERNGRTYTMGDLKAALGRKNADVAREATQTRNKLERMIKSGALNDFPKDVRARIAQAVSAHKKNPNNSVAAGALNALYAKHVGGVYKDTPTDFERDDIVPSESETFTDENGQPLERGLLQYGPVGENAPIQRDAGGFTSSNPAYNMTGRAQSPESRRIKGDDKGVVTQSAVSGFVRDDEVAGLAKTVPLTDDYGNTVTRSVTQKARGSDTVPSRGEDNMSPNTTALPENARALYKAESPAEWIVGVLAPRNGVEAAAKAWRTVKNATTDKMKKSRDLMARALHSISSMEPNDFRLTFNKELTAQQAQTMINRAKSVIDQEKVPDDRPDVVGRSAPGEGRQDEGRPGQARGADARVESRATSNSGQVAQALQRPDTEAVAQGVAAAKFTELTKAQIAKFVKQLDADDDRVSDAAEKALNKLEADFLAKAKEVGQIKDDEARLRATKALFDAAQELGMGDEFNKGYDQLERSAAVAGNAFEKLRNDIARFASKDFVEALDQDIEDAVNRLEVIDDDLGGDLERGINLFDTLRSIKAEQEAQQGKLFNKQGQNAQTPGEATTDAKRTAELKAALDEVKRLLGKDFDAQVSNELFDPVSGVGWSGEFDPQQMRILIAAGATDTMGTGRHEALHALFKMLRDMGHPEAVKVIENLAKNAAVMSQLKKHLADHKNALEQLKDPEEAAAYAFQFWMADQLKLGPQAKTFFQKVMDFLNKAQLALRDKVFGSEVAKDERARLKQDALALKLLGAFRDGAMASPEGRVSVQAVLEANKQALEARRLNTRAFGHKLHNFLKQGVYSAASVFEDSANPHVKALGKMFFRMEGDVRGEKQSFLEAAAQANDRYQVKVRNILVKLDKDTAELVSKYMNNRTELKDIHHPEAHEAVKDLRDLLDDLLLYQRNMNTARWDAEKMEWVPMGEVEKNYYPRVWSINVLTEKQGEFIEKMTKALEKYRRDFKGFPEIEEFHADTMAKAILNKLINGAGSNDIEEMTSDLGITPWQASVNKRDLNWLDDVAPGEFTEYFSNDVAEVMTSYVSQATKRAEYNHAFGRGGEKLREGMYAAIVHEMGGEELTQKATARLKTMSARKTDGEKPNIVAAAREVLLEDRLEALNPNMEWTKEMLAMVRMGEYGFLEGGSVKAEDVAKVREEVDKIHADAVAKLDPVTKAIMAMEGTLGREIDPTLRHVMSGVTTFQNFRLLPLALFASINDVVGMVARGGTMKDSFQAFTRGIKEVGLMWKGEYSQDELAKLAERLGTVGGGNYLDAMGQTYSSQFMYGKLRRWNDALFKWNGLEAWNRAARIQATGVAIEFIKRHVEKPNEHSKRYLEELFGKDYDTSLIMKDGDLDYSNDRVQEAVLTWVNGAVLRPNASHRPIYASDPHYMLFYHLKQFAYSFHKVILRRAWIEAKAGNYTPAAALFTGYVPVSIAADVVKETLIMGDDDPWWTKGGLTAYLEHGVARANLGGVPQMWLGDIADPVMAFKDPGRYVGSLSNVAGPAPDQLIDLISVPFLEDKTLVKEAAGGVPGGVLIRRYVD